MLDCQEAGGGVVICVREDEGRGEPRPFLDYPLVEASRGVGVSKAGAQAQAEGVRGLRGRGKSGVLEGEAHGGESQGGVAVQVPFLGGQEVLDVEVNDLGGQLGSAGLDVETGDLGNRRMSGGERLRELGEPDADGRYGADAGDDHVVGGRFHATLV